MATKTPERIGRLALVGPVGVKLGPQDKLDIPDIFAMPQDEVTKLVFHDVEKGRLDVANMTDEQLVTVARNRETTALLAWEPWMHNPKLRHRLHRVSAPTLFIRGASDGLVSQSYVEGYAKLMPNARVTTIATAGHAPQLEQPEEFVRVLFAFLDGGTQTGATP
jgi:pimeloyl-ACP methyl ester carboxylesterase